MRREGGDVQIAKVCKSSALPVSHVVVKKFTYVEGLLVIWPPEREGTLALHGWVLSETHFYPTHLLLYGVHSNKHTNHSRWTFNRLYVCCP